MFFNILCYIEDMKTSFSRKSLNALRKEIKRNQFALIIAVTILLTVGGAVINISSNDKAFNQALVDTSRLVSRLYTFSKNMEDEDFYAYMDGILNDLPDIDVISIVDKNNRRIYHAHHQLINTQFDGSHPDLKKSLPIFLLKTATDLPDLREEVTAPSTIRMEITKAF